MKLCIVGLLVCLAVANAIAFNSIHEEWKLYKTVHKKSYKNHAEDSFRMMVFKNNKDLVEKHNKLYESGASTFKMAVNKYSDLLHEEFVARNKYNRSASIGLKKNIRVFSGDAPDSADWRNNGAVTGVKDQGQCGSCWAFSTTGSLEGQIFLQKGNLISYSEQDLVDCSSANGGCNGGNVDVAFNDIQSAGGIDTEDSYPYEAVDQNCQYDSSKSGGVNTGYNRIPQGDEDQLKQVLGSVGPISVAIDASNPSFQQYGGGVYNEPSCSPDNLDHAVLAVGYGTDDDGNDYYIVKNSWGSDWGEDGYIMMSRNNNNNCGIATDAGYPSV